MSDIILVGPKHCGKTSAGKALALLYSDKLVPCTFLDLDELILQRTGKTPRQLYNEGQAVFQKAEADTFNSLFNAGGEEGIRVISTGGGIIDNPEAVTLLSQLKNSGIVIVHLNAAAASAWQRIAASGELPLFLKTENPQETHRILHERRTAAYQQLADIVIDTEGKTPDEIAALLLHDI